jgi:O-succinylbenzoic acid--CoA ligase
MKIAADGEILVRGKTLFMGYLEDGQITSAIDSDGWFHSGDIGYFDDNGSLFVVGRKDNMFISGGENIHPEEIEAALMEIDEVTDAVVVPVKNPEFGYRPVAFVRTEPQREITADDLPGLPSFKIPIKFYDWPRKYETGGIKLDRRHFHKLVKDMYEHF